MKQLRAFVQIGVALAVLLLFGGLANGQQQLITGQPGVASGRAVISMQGMATLEKLRNQTNHVKRAIPLPMPRVATQNVAGAVGPMAAAGAPPDPTFAAAALPPVGPSPPTATSFQALDDTDTVIPPDTHGAVGPNHVMAVHNDRIRVQDRSGAILLTMTLLEFWRPLGVTEVFDPKTLYDPYENRWMFTTAANSLSDQSSLLIAVSQTTDPTGAWNLYRVDADAGNAAWADYPSVGFNKDWIVVSVNMFAINPLEQIVHPSYGVNIFVFNKTNLYANGAGQFTLLKDESLKGFTPVPAITYDTALSTMYLVQVDNLYNSLSPFSLFPPGVSRLEISTISGPIGSEVMDIASAYTPSTNAWFPTDIAFFSFGGSGQQLGFPFFLGVDLGDTRIQNVVYRNGSLWCTHTFFEPLDPLNSFTPITSGVQWWQMTPTGQIEQFGRIEDPNPSGFTSYAYPSIAVNRCNDVLIGYSSFSPLQYPSANYSFRYGTDPANVLRSPALLKAGEAPYFKTFAGFANRWGDYSSTVVDPVNDVDMWTIQEYSALPPGSLPTNGISITNIIDIGRWATWWGRIDVIGASTNQILFSSGSYTVTEGQIPAFATITILNAGGTPGSVDYSTSEGTPMGTKNFAAGQTSTTFQVPIPDDSEINPTRTITLTLSNPQGGAILGCLSTAVLTILDDETLGQPNIAGEFTFSTYLNYGFPYWATEDETKPSALCGGNIRNIVQPDRSAPGAIVTVIRTNGHTGRVMVDFSTEPGGSGLAGFDYISTNGTLVFDDYQMSSTFVVPILSDDTFFFLNGPKWVRVVLSNPRAAPEEDPEIIKPKLSHGSESGIYVEEINGGFLADPLDPTSAINRWWNIERNNYRVDEYGTNGNVRQFFVDVTLFPNGGPGNVTLEVSSVLGNQTYFTPFFPLFDRAPDPRPKVVLNAGSERAEAFEHQDFIVNGTVAPFSRNIVWANPINQDVSQVTITNYSDYSPIRVNVPFAGGQCRQSVLITITNDSTVEFNEDFIVYLRGPANPNVFGPHNFTTVTILYDDAPAGALDREWNPDNASHTFPAFNPTPGADQAVSAVAVQADGKTVLAGDFQNVNAQFRNHVARMNTDGSLDTSFQGDASGFVTALALYPTNSPNAGKTLIVGGFRAYNGVNVYGIARLLPNGARDPSFNAGTGTLNPLSPNPDGVDPIRAIALQADGRIVIGGDFTLFNGVDRAGLARLNTDGSLDLTFNPGAALSSADTVWALALQSDGAGGQRVLVAGDFDSFNGEPMRGIARLNTDGSVDLTFDPGSGAEGAVYELAVQADRRILLAGDFSRFNEREFTRIVRLDPDGSVDDSFSPGRGPNDAIFALTLQADGKALIGGWFTKYDGTRRVGLARLHLDGSLDTSFMDTAYNQFAGLINNFSFETANFVDSIAVQADGNVIIGGSFTQVGGNPSTNAPLRNPWTVFTRADKRVRYNIARILGGVTPGPGNASFDTQNYFVNEDSGTASLKVVRTDGRLGTLTAASMPNDRLAMAGADYLSNVVTTVWPEMFYMTNYLSVEPYNWTPVSVGLVEPLFVRVPIINDPLQEGNELVDLRFIEPGGSVTLGGEIIPLGGALGRSAATLTIADDDVDHGTFSFSMSKFTVGENSGQAIITVVRTNGSFGQATIDFSTGNALASPRATPGPVGVGDYNRVFPTRMIFPHGVTSQTIAVTIHPDDAIENDENIGLVLSNPQGGRLPNGQTNVTATLTIIDADFPPGRLNFSDLIFTTNEDAGVAVITVTRTGGAQGRVSVDYTTADGTATAPADYITTTGQLIWNDAESGPKTFTIPLVADGIVDNNATPIETVALRLLNPIVGASANPILLGSQTNATLQIVDADSYGTLAFGQPVYQADENGGSATVSVIRRNGVAGTASVQFSVSPGTGYVPTNGTLTFLPGEIGKSFTVVLLDDSQRLGDNQVSLSLANPINAVLGTPNPAILIIVDNELSNIPAGELDDSFSTNAVINGPVFALGLHPDGRIVVAGDFTEVNNVPRIGVARLTTGGALDPSLNVGAGPNATIRAMVLQPDGKMLLGGFFTSINGTNRNRIARINSDGSIDSAFSLSASFADNQVHALALQPDGRILVGGSFTTFNGDDRAGIVRLHTNGLTDLSFTVGAGANAAVYAVALQGDGKILIGGEFTAVQGQPRAHIARLLRNGTLDSTFNPTVEAAVRALLVQADGGVVAGGSFTTANGVARNRLARFNSDGTLDTGFLASPLAGADNVVLALAQQIDGKLLVAGDFRQFNSVTRNRLTRLNPDGGNDPTINFGNGADSFVACLAIQPDRKIVFGGGFTSFDDRPRRRIARIFGGSVAGAGTLEYAQAGYLVQENGTNAMITVRRRGGTTGVAGVNFTTADGTALAGVDYQLTSGTLTFPEAETRLSFLVPIFDNSANSGDRAFTVRLIEGTYTGGAVSGPQPIASVIVLDDEGQITFSSADYNTSENASSGATITVQRRGGSNTLATVNFSTANGTAVAPLDYLATNGTLTFLPGESSKNFRVPIINDSLIEPRESVLLTLSSPSGSNALGIASATLLIADDEFAVGQLVLGAASYTVGENATNAVLTVLRTNGYSGIVTVQYATVGGTATPGQDYASTNNTLTFSDGDTSKTIEVTILDDLLVELSESFSVVLSNPQLGATLGTPSVATVTITNDDTSLIIPAGSSLLSESIATNNIIDAGEMVTMAFSIRNIGSGDTPGLLATLLPGNGVSLCAGPQAVSYGVLLANGPAVTRQFSFCASGNTGDRLVAILQLTDGVTTNGFVSFGFTIGGQATRNFANTNRITINDDAPALPYPSIINVANLGGTVTKVSVTISNLTHGFPDDVDLLLVSPAGERVMLMSDAGSTSSQPHPVNNVTLRFDANAAGTLSDSNQITSGTYRPVNYAGPGQNTSDTFPAPAPQPTTNAFPFTMFPYTNTALSVFNGASPNGAWSLFVVDDAPGQNGSIGGWSLEIQTSDPVAPSAGVSIADLAVSVSGVPASAVVGANYSCIFTITNRGPAPAESVALLDQMPVGLTLVSASVSAGTWSKVQGTLTWNVGSLASGATASMTLVSRPTVLGTLSSTATVSANQIDPSLGNNSINMVTTVLGVPGLTVTRLGGSLRLSWPASSGFKLQANDTLNPANWTDVGTAPLVDNGQNVLTVGVPGSATFYRLRSP